MEEISNHSRSKSSVAVFMGNNKVDGSENYKSVILVSKKIGVKFEHTVILSKNLIYLLRLYGIF